MLKLLLWTLAAQFTLFAFLFWISQKYPIGPINRAVRSRGLRITIGILNVLVVWFLSPIFIVFAMVDWTTVWYGLVDAGSEFWDAFKRCAIEMPRDCRWFKPAPDA